jgi:hypothetical protein
MGRLLGQGRTAEIYAWGEGQVLKLFVPGWPDEAITRESAVLTARRIPRYNPEKAEDVGSTRTERGVLTITMHDIYRREEVFCKRKK